MARLELVQSSGRSGWLDIKINKVVEESERVDLTISFYDGSDRQPWVMTATTAGWQIGLIYIEILARSFIRASNFAHTQFPVSYYSESDDNPAKCTLHLDIEWLHVLLRGSSARNRPDRLIVELFALDFSSGQFVHFGGICVIHSAELFGEDLLKEFQLKMI